MAERYRTVDGGPGPDLDLAADAFIKLFASTQPRTSALDIDVAAAKRRNEERLERERRGRQAARALRAT